MIDDRGSASFYLAQAERLTRLAAETTKPALRLELLEIAASFQRLAAYAAANANAGTLSGSQPA